ncbi:MAG TPA: hypothetical protein VLA92_02870 [Candidatus Saccharimonadales bacterium]|nr:hypothetical protein [Candidatus Saccharimonadales bacterium]
MKRPKSIPSGHPEAKRPDYKFWSVSGRLELINHAREELTGSSGNKRAQRAFDSKAETSEAELIPPTIDDINTALEYGKRARNTKNRLVFASGIALGGLALGAIMVWTSKQAYMQNQEHADHKQVVGNALRDPFVLEDLGICETELRAQEQLTRENQRTHRLSKGMPGASDYEEAVRLAAERNFPCDGRIDEVTYFVDRRKVVIEPSDITEFNLSDICEAAEETRTARGWIAADVAREANMDC